MTDLISMAEAARRANIAQRTVRDRMKRLGIIPIQTAGAKLITLSDFKSIQKSPGKVGRPPKKQG